MPTPRTNPDQLPPSHLASRFTGRPPALVKPPPTYTLLPATAIANTVTVLTPAPKADQLLPSHLAIRLALPPLASVKRPPTYTSEPLTTIALTLLFTPLPSGIQSVPSLRTMFVLRWPEELPAKKLPPTYTSLLWTAMAFTKKLLLVPAKLAPGSADHLAPS